MMARRSATSLLIGGIALIVLAGALAYPRLALYVETQLYTRRIPTAPALETSGAQGDMLTALLPANDGDADMPTLPAPTLTPTPLAVIEGPRPVSGVTPTLTPTPYRPAVPIAEWSGATPIGLSIPSIGLEAPIGAIGLTLTTVGGQSQAIWDVPNERRAGWHNTSARLGVPGNTVLNGHNTSNGEVFRDLYKVEVGGQIFVEGDDEAVYVYRVEQKYILREAGQPLSVRIENARYIQETADERLTLVTCHPYGSLANRLVLIAFPVTETNSDRGGAN